MEIFPHKHCLLQLPRFPLYICIMANPLLKDIWVAFNLLLLQRMLKWITLHIHHFVWAHICICRIKLQGLNCCDKVCICSFDKMLSIQNQFALPPAMYENAYSLTALATVCYQIWQFLPIWYLSIMLIYISLIICKVEPYLPICIRDIFISFSVNCLFTFFAHLFFFFFFLNFKCFSSHFLGILSTLGRLDLHPYSVIWVAAIFLQVTICCLSVLMVYVLFCQLEVFILFVFNVVIFICLLFLDSTFESYLESSIPT